MMKFRQNVANRIVNTVVRAAGPDYPDEALLQAACFWVSCAKAMLSRGYVAAMNQAVAANRLTKEEAVDQGAFMVLSAMRAGVVNEALPVVTAVRTRCRTCGKYHPYVECAACRA